jgi:hypothetical protein
LDKLTLHTTIEKVKIVFLLCIFHDGYTHLKNKIKKTTKNKVRKKKRGKYYLMEQEN